MSFFPVTRIFFSIFSLVKKHQRSARFRCLKIHGFRACVEEKYDTTYTYNVLVRKYISGALEYISNIFYKEFTFIKKIYAKYISIIYLFAKIYFTYFRMYVKYIYFFMWVGGWIPCVDKITF